jgi:hypothetical protein
VRPFLECGWLATGPVEMDSSTVPVSAVHLRPSRRLAGRAGPIRNLLRGASQALSSATILLDGKVVPSSAGNAGSGCGGGRPPRSGKRCRCRRHVASVRKDVRRTILPRAPPGRSGQRGVLRPGRIVVRAVSLGRPRSRRSIGSVRAGSDCPGVLCGSARRGGLDWSTARPPRALRRAHRGQPAWAVLPDAGRDQGHGLPRAPGVHRQHHHDVVPRRAAVPGAVRRLEVRPSSG